MSTRTNRGGSLNGKPQTKQRNAKSQHSTQQRTLSSVAKKRKFPSKKAPLSVYASTNNAGLIENTDTVKILITEDKLKLILKDFVERIGNSKLWLSVLSLFLTILIPIITSNFKNAFSVPESVWIAGFYILAGCTLVWLIYCVYITLRNKKKCSVDYLIGEIKNEHKQPKMMEL